MAKEAKCPFCASPAERDYDFGGGIYRYHCQHCGVFVLQRADEEDFLNRERWREENSADKISAVLSERHLQGLPPPFLLFRDRREYTVQHSPAIHVDELRRNWPATVPERIDRSFVALVRNLGAERVGALHKPDAVVFKDIVFALDEKEGRFIRDAMEEYGWIRRPTPNAMDFKITPEGWAKFDELTRSGSDARNPVFVAMWFGRPQQDGDPDRSEEMLTLFDERIRTACTQAGWDAKRADTDEHNEPIMDKIIADIRKAPFLIADLTENNQGVYYEAGLAHGLGREVIFCCPQGQNVHFDVTGINRVVYEGPDQLYKRLLNRILKTMGEGPFI